MSQSLRRSMTNYSHEEITATVAMAFKMKMQQIIEKLQKSNSKIFMELM